LAQEDRETDREQRQAQRDAEHGRVIVARPGTEVELPGHPDVCHQEDECQDPGDDEQQGDAALDALLGLGVGGREL